MSRPVVPAPIRRVAAGRPGAPVRRATATPTLAALAAFALAGCPEPAVPGPTVGTLAPLPGADGPRGLGEARVEVGAATPPGPAMLHHDGGAFLLLDAGTALAAVDPGAVRLDAGRLWVDATGAGALDVALPHGTLVVRDAAASVTVGDGGRAAVHVAAGEVGFRGPGGEGQARQGERLDLTPDAADVGAADLWADWTGGLAEPRDPALGVVAPVGVLSGRRMGALGVARTPLPLRSHTVDATVRGDVVTTVVTQRFFNARSEALDTAWTLRLPEGAILGSFEVDRGDGFVPAAVGTLETDDRGGLRWRDPGPVARLVRDGPDRVRAAIAPVPAGATVGLRLRTTSWITRRGDRRRLRVPLAFEAGRPPAIGELAVTVDATAAGAVKYVRANAGAEVEGRVVRLRASDARPVADLHVDLFDAKAPPPDLARAHVVDAADAVAGAAGDDAPFVRLDLPLDGLGPAAVDGPPALVVLVDASAATDPADLALARTLVETLAHRVGPGVALRVVDDGLRTPAGAPADFQATPEALVEALARVAPGGGTDLGRAFREAAALVAGRPRGAVVYLGDGRATVGALTEAELRAELALLPDPPRFFALALGEAPRVGLLRALLGADAVRPVEARRDGTRAVLELLAATSRPVLRRVEVELGEGIERALPASPIPFVPAGGTLRIVGRLRDALPSEITLRARSGADVVERTYRVDRVETPVEPEHVARRWGEARLAAALAEGAGREAVAALALRFGLLSPWNAWTVGGSWGGGYAPVRWVDLDPRPAPPAVEVALGDAREGWRRRLPGEEAPPPIAALRTWAPRPNDGAGAPATGDGQLAEVSARVAIERGAAGPRSCLERERLLRPSLAGGVTVEVDVGDDGAVRAATVVSSDLGLPGVEACVRNEVRGLRFPAIGATTVTHTFVLEGPGPGALEAAGCSEASRHTLDVRRAVWRERLAEVPGPEWGVTVWRQAGERCELDTWAARRALLRLVLRSAGGISGRLAVWRALRGDPAVAGFLRRAILRSVRRPEDLPAIRAVLGVDPGLDWRVFGRGWARAADDEARLALVRRWLAVVPDDVDLRLRLLALLEATGRDAEATTVARDLQADPFADARALDAVAGLWSRRGDRGEARRALGQIVEHAPVDPAARRALADALATHGFAEEAADAYRRLVALRPDAPEARLVLARAVAATGRLDEGLRVAEALAESAEPDAADGDDVPAAARLWLTVRLAAAALDHADDPDAAAAVAARRRTTGARRDPPALLAALTWSRPDDAPELRVRVATPDTPAPDPVDSDVGGPELGLWGTRLRTVPDGAEITFEVARVSPPEAPVGPPEPPRPLEAELLVILAPFTDAERILRLPVAIPAGEEALDVALEAGALVAR